jgi:hypothetical protein
MPRPVVPIFSMPAFSLAASRAMSSGGVERQDQWAGLADAQARSHFDTGFFEAFDFFEQLGDGQHHTVADVALDAGPHDAARESGAARSFLPLMTRVWPALWPPWKAHHALGGLGQPVDQFALALIAPLGAHDDHVAARDGRACAYSSDSRFTV